MCEVAWVVIGQVGVALAMLIGVRLLTEFLSPDVYGTLALLMGLMALGRGLFCQPVLQLNCLKWTGAATLRF